MRARSRMASIDSSLAGAMKLHVLTTSTSAASGSSTSSWPRRASTPSMISLSTWFFGQPRVTRWTRRRPGAGARIAASLTEVRELESDAEVVSAQELDHGLQIVPLLAGDADLIPLDRHLHLPLGVLHELHDLAALVGRDALLQVHALLRAARRAGLDGPRLHRLQRNLAAGQLLAQDLTESAHLVVVRGQQVERVLLAPELRLGVLEVEALPDLAQGLVDCVVDLLQVDAADHVEGRHEAGVNRQADAPRQPRAGA